MNENAQFSPTRSYKEDLIARLRARHDHGAGYLDAALEESAATFLLAMKDVIDAYGGETALARHTGLHRVSLHKIASGRGNPTLNSLVAVLDAMGMRLAVVDRQKEIGTAHRSPAPKPRRSAGSR